MQGEGIMYQQILVPVDLTEIDLARSAIDIAAEMVRNSGGSLRLLHVLPMTPMMLAEYVPPDFEEQQRKSAEEALAKVASECGLEQERVSTIVRQGGIYHEVLEEAKAIAADLIVMSSHRPAMRSYFLGSNAGHVVRYATCSVLVVRR
jgi:nucleotide-binding universal stress UspA family protein